MSIQPQASRRGFLGGLIATLTVAASGVSLLKPAPAAAKAVGSTEWLVCNGQAISRTTYGELFAVLGDTFGRGEDDTTFNLPDMRARVVVGVDGGPISAPSMLIEYGINPKPNGQMPIGAVMPFAVETALN